MATYDAFVKGVDENHQKHKMSSQAAKRILLLKHKSDTSYFANSEDFSHLESSDIPQPKGKIYRGNH